MLNTYIKNRGITQTLVHNNNKNHFNEINWDADYDGNIASISIISNTDGNNHHFDVKLDNNDLASILNVPSVSMPIDKRLLSDFHEPIFRNQDRIMQVEFPNTKTPKLLPIQPSYVTQESETNPQITSIEDIIRSSNHNNYLSSPLPNEELIIPITINKKTSDKYSFTPRRRNKHKKTHKTYKVYKKHKSSSSSKSKSKSKSKSANFSLF